MTVPNDVVDSLHGARAQLSPEDWTLLDWFVADEAEEVPYQPELDPFICSQRLERMQRAGLIELAPGEATYRTTSLGRLMQGVRGGAKGWDIEIPTLAPELPAPPAPARGSDQVPVAAPAAPHPVAGAVEELEIAMNLSLVERAALAGLAGLLDPQVRVKRLRELGILERVGGGMYELSTAGHRVLRMAMRRGTIA